MMRQIAYLALIATATASCSGGKSENRPPEQEAPWAPAKLTSVKGVPAAEIEAAIKRKLDAKAPAKIDDDQWGHTKRLYKVYGGNPLWLDKNGLHGDRTFALANAVIQAEQDGMRMDAYPVGALAQSLATVEQKQTPTADELADADIILTASFAALGEDYLTGQVDPKSVSQAWHIDVGDENVDSALVRAIRISAIDKAIHTMRPQDEDYLGLRQSLDRYQQIVVKGGWPGVPEGKAVKPGEPVAPARAAALRRRLAVEGYLTDTTTQAGVYDQALAGAVAQFQARHAINVDSMLGKETVEALNQSAAYRAAQIAANLERMRWLPKNFGSRYVYVNVPAFRLEAYDGGKLALEMKVIVGEDFEDRSTPVFSDVMETVVFRPYWNVTPDIARKEIFPKIDADPGYLAANDYELYKEGGETRVRQRPGDKNALGKVKFLFPNDFNIYLHDTSNPELFKEDVRAFSHGCIRIEKPAEFAQWVLGWDAGKVQSWMNSSNDNQSVKVSQKIPVYITYGTAYVRDGQLHFGNDLYDRDDKLVAQVLRGALPTPETVAAVQALRRIASRA